MALELGGSFYATALRHEPRGSRALLARLGRGAAAVPALHELASLEGDVPPPRLAVDGDDLLVAVEDTADRTWRVRVARLSAALLAGKEALPPLDWRDGPRPTRDESNAYDFAAGQGLALFAWDDWPAGEAHGRVYVLSVPRDGAASEPVALSGAEVDAEEPRLVPRPGGFWLSWLVATTAAARERVYDPGERESRSALAAGGRGALTSSAAEEGAGGARLPLRGGTPYGARGIEILALDAAGRPAGNVRRIRTDAARVVGYDLTTSPNGNAWLVWRQDAPSPSAAGGRVFMVEVHGDGPGEPLLLREGDVGSGAPSWLGAAAGASGSTGRWLTFPDERDRTLLLSIELPLSPPEPLALAAHLQGASALAAGVDEILFALPRGRALELLGAACGR